MIPPRACLRRVLAVFGTAAAAVAAAPRSVLAQATRADSAAILYDAAQRLNVEGKRAAADALLDFILRRFGDTPVASRVRAELSSRPAEPERSGRLELLAWGTIYGAWLGVAGPTAAQATGTAPYGIGLIVGGPIGYFASKAYADAARPTLGQARAMTLAFRQPNGAQLAAAIPTIASAIGLAVGVRLAKSAERSSMAPAPAGPEAVALLQMGEGGTRFGVPMPVPTFVPVGQQGVRRVDRPVLRVPLIAASF